MDFMDIMDIMDFMDNMDIMNIMNIMNITAWMAMAVLYCNTPHKSTKVMCPRFYHPLHFTQASLEVGLLKCVVCSV